MPEGFDSMDLKDLNVLFITIDCFRVDHAGWMYEKSWHLTPYLNEISRKSVIFKNAISAGSSTPASFPALITSTYPLMYSDYPRISSIRKSIAEVLRENGYRTGAFHSNPYLSRSYKYNRGFDIFEDHIKKEKDANETGKASVIEKTKLKMYHVKKDIHSRFKGTDLPYERASTINNDFYSFLNKGTGKFFAWLHYMDAHHPVIPPQDFCTYSKKDLSSIDKIYRGIHPASDSEIKKIRELYAASIKYIDSEIGNLFEFLKEKNEWDNTVVIITADHGEEFMEHGDFSHKAKMYDELIHVPLMIRIPKLGYRMEIDEPIGTINIAPTVSDMVGIGNISEFTGKSMLPYMERNGETVSEKNEGVISETLTMGGKVTLSMETGKYLISYRTKRYKYIFNFETSVAEGYDLVKDPYERHNIFYEERDLFDEHVSAIEKHMYWEKRSRNATIGGEKLKKIKLPPRRN